MSLKPSIDQQLPTQLQTATFASGCFWSPDAIFGLQDGVVRTRVGYAGGTTEAPTYKTIGDHMETLQIDYDPEKIDYGQLLDLFFTLHKPMREPWKRQYAAAAFYHSAAQLELISDKVRILEEKAQQKVLTEVKAYENFYLSEERHQKYKLQRQPELLAEFSRMYPSFRDLVNSTAAARVNGYLYACKDCKKLASEIGNFGLTERGQKILLDTVTNSSGIACSRVLQN